MAVLCAQNYNSLGTKLLDILQWKKSVLTRSVAVTDFQHFVLSDTLEKHLKFLTNSRTDSGRDSLKSPPTAELSYRILICPHLLCRICPFLCNAIENTMYKLAFMEQKKMSKKIGSLHNLKCKFYTG